MEYFFSQLLTLYNTLCARLLQYLENKIVYILKDAHWNLFSLDNLALYGKHSVCIFYEV